MFSHGREGWKDLSERGINFMEHLPANELMELITGTGLLAFGVQFLRILSTLSGLHFLWGVLKAGFTKAFRPKVNVRIAERSPSKSVRVKKRSWRRRKEHVYASLHYGSAPPPYPDYYESV